MKLNLQHMLHQQNKPRERNWESTSLCNHFTKYLKISEKAKPWSCNEQNLSVLVVPMQREERLPFQPTFKVLQGIFLIFFSVLSCFRNRLRMFWNQSDFGFGKLCLVFIFKKSRFKIVNLINFHFLWWGNDGELIQFGIGCRGVIRKKISPIGTYNHRNV